jgi:outer membrane autotransporter protein
MKKIVLATSLALAALTASALELGVTATRGDQSGDARNYGGITLTQPYGKVNVAAGFERSTVGNHGNQNRWSLVGGYDVAKLGSVTVTPKIGYAYLDNQSVKSGNAYTVGVGAAFPVTEQVSFTADYAYQKALESAVEQFNGNRVTLGVKYRF